MAHKDKKTKRMPGAAKHEDYEDLERTLAIVAHWYNRGHTLYQIRDRLREERGLEVSHVTVSKYVDTLVKRWREESTWERQTYVSQTLLQINDLMLECWNAWERSKEDEVTRTQEMTVPLRLKEAAGKYNAGKDGRHPYKEGTPEGELMLAKETIRKANRLPASQYLGIVMQCIQARRELLGLDAPKETKEDSKGGGKVLMDWSSRAASLPPMEEVEAEIARVRGALLPPSKQETK